MGIDFHELRITSSASGEFSGPEAQLEPSGPIRRTIQRRRPSPSGAVGDKRETSTEWLEHVGVGEDEGARTLYTCLWSEVKDGKTTLCGFQREKSSVKRHIEAIHLKFKYVLLVSHPLMLTLCHGNSDPMLVPIAPCDFPRRRR